MKKNILKFAAIAAVVGLSAFTSSKRAVQWHFKGNSVADITDYNAYDLGTASTPGCGSGTTYPCNVNFPDGINTPEALDVFMDGKTSTDILALSAQQRN